MLYVTVLPTECKQPHHFSELLNVLFRYTERNDTEGIAHTLCTLNNNLTFHFHGLLTHVLVYKDFYVNALPVLQNSSTWNVLCEVQLLAFSLGRRMLGASSSSRSAPLT